MKVMMQRLNQVKYAYTKEQEEALKRKGFRAVEPERKEEEAEAPADPQPEEKEEKPKGRRAKGEGEKND